MDDFVLEENKLKKLRADADKSSVEGKEQLVLQENVQLQPSVKERNPVKMTGNTVEPQSSYRQPETMTSTRQISEGGRRSQVWTRRFRQKWLFTGYMDIRQE